MISSSSENWGGSSLRMRAVLISYMVLWLRLKIMIINVNIIIIAVLTNLIIAISTRSKCRCHCPTVRRRRAPRWSPHPLLFSDTIGDSGENWRRKIEFLKYISSIFSTKPPSLFLFNIAIFIIVSKFILVFVSICIQIHICISLRSISAFPHQKSVSHLL